ncbi:MAG: hypothetical protein MUC95_10825, partial [Spirochaetes bacterium]|nr:hypothetical protein [Spirochaetota bacterium]
MKAVTGKLAGRNFIFILIILLVFTVSEIYTQENEPNPVEEKIEERAPEQPVQPVVEQPPIQPVVEQPVEQNKPPVKKEKELKKNPKKKTFKLNFKEVEMTEFLNMMSELIGKNIIV